MAKSNKGIWAYIGRRSGTKNWVFKKRWPVDVAEILQEPHDRRSLGTANDEVAEKRARDFLAEHEARVLAVRERRPVIDLSNVHSLEQLPGQARSIIDRLSRVSKIVLPDAVLAALSEVAPDQYISMYMEVQKDDLRNRFHDELRRGGVIIKADSALFQAIYNEYHQDKLKALASFERVRRMAEASNLPIDDLGAFEQAVMSKAPDKKLPYPTLRISEVWKKYLEDKLLPSGIKRLDEEIDRHQQYVSAFMDWVGDKPMNHVMRTDVGEFLTALAKRPANLTKPERTMSFRAIVARNHGRPTITHKGAIEWFSRLNRIFAYGERIYRDQFEIKNPWADMKSDVKGTDGTVKREWHRDEVAALFEQDEFSDPKRRDSFFYSVLCALAHGNRLSEFHSRRIDELRYDDELKFHYLDITDAKNSHSVRKVPIAEVVIKAGFLDWVENNRKAGHQWLFPNEDHSDVDSRKFSREFGKYLKRCRLYDPHRTLHNFRNTFETNGYDTAYPANITYPQMVIRRITGHANKDIHEGYIGKNFHQMKVVVDTVRIKGLPYNRFGM